MIPPPLGIDVIAPKPKKKEEPKKEPPKKKEEPKKKGKV